VCGIFGFFSPHSSVDPPQDLLSRMARTLWHRGPDEGGFYRDGPVGLGSRRLSIVDLETGRQPLRNETGEIRLICNGEIYNAPDLRRRLEGRHRFLTRSDAEVILHLYEDHGTDLLNRVEGMFAIALWDGAGRRLLLGRDRAGEKPLFHVMHRGVLYFASEISALRQVEGIGTELDPEALRLYLSFGYFPAPWSPYRDIRKMEPGTVALFEEGRPAPQFHTYWNLLPHAAAGALHPDRSQGAAGAAGVLRDMVEASVRRQRMSDVPVGIALSGGIDSGWIAAIASRQWGEPVHTFTVSFHDRSYDEGAEAAGIARRLGTIHHEARADRPSLVRALHALSRHMDEPLGDPAILPTYLLVEAARREVKVLLGGEGADELFAGYPTYLGHRLARRYLGLPGWLRHRIIGPLIEAWPPSDRPVSIDFLLKRFVGGAERPLLERHLAWFGILDPAEAVSLPGPLLDGPSPGASAVDVLHGMLGDGDEWGRAELEKILYLDFRTYLGEGLLTKLDRVSMACSLETRSPYLSRELMEYAARLPVEWKLKGFAMKWILKEAARNGVPGELLARRKHGLSVPLAGMFRSELRELLRAELDPARLDREGLLRGEVVARIVEEHLSRRADRSRGLWALLSLVLWYRQHALARTRETAADVPAEGVRSVASSADTEARGHPSRLSI
jgi:asparagine synthase (glutamine-hydrolysing)